MAKNGPFECPLAGHNVLTTTQSVQLYSGHHMLLNGDAMFL